MIYRSNLTAPDLTPRFKLRKPAIQLHGHDMPSDPDFLPNCGYWTHDEAAILYTVACQVGGRWLDIGSRLGWTSAHILAAPMVKECQSVDPEYAVGGDFLRRAVEQCPAIIPIALTSQKFMSWCGMTFDGFVIDGCHDAPEPVKDAAQAWRLAASGDSVILFHDFWGQPVQDGVTFLMERGWKCRIYNTPNGVALCWRGGKFVPPDHAADPLVKWHHVRAAVKEFDFKACL